MAKQYPSAKKATPVKSPAGTKSESRLPLFEWLPFKSWTVAVGILAILSFVLYLNTTSNRFALDDGMVILENNYTKEGFKGIGKILSGDSFEGIFGENASVLAGGRYRPLSLITFAIEWQFYGGKDAYPALAHGWNALLYAVCVFLAGNWLYKYVFHGRKFGADLAFLATFLFAIHPIHTEAVANLKGRDELLCFIFMMLTVHWLFDALTQKDGKKWIMAGIAFFLALLSKENAITFVGILPLSVYFLLPKVEKKGIMQTAGVFFGVFLFYFLIRISVTNFSLQDKSQDVLNQPYILASPSEKLATKIYVLNKYLALLFFPYPLSFDYSYAQIPYKTFGDWQVWLSILIHALMLGIAIRLFPKRHILSYGILFYLFSISIVSNFVINIGAFLGERFLFQASLGFCIVMAYLIGEGLKKLPSVKPILYAGMVGILLLAGGWVMKRNQDWKDNNVLFMTDVKTVPRSAKAQKGAGEVLIKQVDLLQPNDPNRIPMIKRAIEFYTEALKIHPRFVDATLDIGAAHYRLENWDLAEKFWLQAEKLDADHPVLKSHFALMASKYVELANKAYNQSNFTKCVALCRKAQRFNPNSPDASYIMAMAYGRMRQFAEALPHFQKATTLNPANADYWFNYGGVAFEAKEYAVAETAFTKSLQINPNNPMAQQGLEAAKVRLAK
jgi:tetratricopeptide (TPR) repeat protein